jgi:hypothetical protein
VARHLREPASFGAPLLYAAVDLAAGRLVSVLEGGPRRPSTASICTTRRAVRRDPRSRRSWNSCAHRTLDPWRAVQVGLHKAGVTRSTGSLTADRKLDRRATIDKSISPRLEIAEQLAHTDVLRLFGGLGVKSFGLELHNLRFLTDGVER